MEEVNLSHVLETVLIVKVKAIKLEIVQSQEESETTVIDLLTKDREEMMTMEAISLKIIMLEEVEETVGVPKLLVEVKVTGAETKMVQVVVGIQDQMETLKEQRIMKVDGGRKILKELMKNRKKETLARLQVAGGTQMTNLHHKIKVEVGGIDDTTLIIESKFFSFKYLLI
jgi:hypothetical protein